ncbi:MAG TPA: hypothetical protein VFI20_12060 [Terracidiphilus sp.]|nr:hypothetical protein [Terracidiphilus sp.]
MRVLLIAVAAAFFITPAWAGAVVRLRIDYSNPRLIPSGWTLVLYPDGAGHFRSERGTTQPSKITMEPTDVDKKIQLSQQFTEHVFAAMQHGKLLDENCESHMKVAFQGWKKFTYSGPDGERTCEFNYSKDKQLQGLGDAFIGVANTIIEGARLEMLLDHDPLGLDSEMGFILEASHDGRLRQLCTIRGILEKLASNPSVMERVRRRARILLARADK